MSGYLNLLANCIDNFTHGLAVGGSYLVSCRVGFVTTCAILLHEIPHEVPMINRRVNFAFNVGNDLLISYKIRATTYILPVS